MYNFILERLEVAPFEFVQTISKYKHSNDPVYFDYLKRYRIFTKNPNTCLLGRFIPDDFLILITALMDRGSVTYKKPVYIFSTIKNF